MKSRSLWEISVVIDPEVEEAVTELAQSVFRLLPSVYQDAESGATTVAVYWPETARPGRRALKALVAGLKEIEQCGLAIGPGVVTVRKLRPQDWAESWKRHFKPIQIGRALLIKPSWSQRRGRKGQAVVVLDPGLSFGTGQHPTTEFCLKQLVAARRPGQAQSFLDIGTGSGILAIAAAKLGYRPVRAIDFDRAAVRVARENARRNRVLNMITVVHADLTRLPVDSRVKYDLVCANLTADLLLSARDRILKRLGPRGRLVLAGILQTQFAPVTCSYRAAGLRLLSAEASQEWKSGLFAFAQ